MRLTNKVYDAAKQAALIWIPALGVLYFALAGIWSLPHPEQVVGTITAVDTFLGVVLHLSTGAYNSSDSRFDGQLSILNLPQGGATVKMTGLDPQAFATKNAVTLQIVDQTTPEPVPRAAQ